MSLKIDKSLTWLETSRLAGRVERMHVIPTIQRYTDAEHVYNAMLIGIELCELENINSDRVIRAILIHDIPEVHTGDIPGNIKLYPDFKKAIAKIESKWSEKNIPDHYRNMKLDVVEWSIVDISDTLELAYSCLDELSMGNRGVSLLGVISNVEDTLITKIEAIPYNTQIVSIVEEIISRLHISVWDILT